MTSRSLVGVAIFLIAGVAAGQGKNSAVRVDNPLRMHTLYGDNEAAADAQYTGRVIEIEAFGRVKKQGGSYVLLAPVRDSEAPGVACRLTAAAATAVADNPGMIYLIRGKCAGREDHFGADSGYVVALEHCAVIGKRPRSPAASQRLLETRRHAR